MEVTKNLFLMSFPRKSFDPELKTEGRESIWIPHPFDLAQGKQVRDDTGKGEIFLIAISFSTWYKFQPMYLLRLADLIFKPSIAYAHCDIPCGIYDPHEAQMAAHTVIRMTTMLNELQLDSEKVEDRKKFVHQVSRLQKVKEDHAELIKHQVRIIWGDYFKSEHLDKYKDLHELVFNIMKQASKARQEVNLDAANQLLASVQKFAEIFWETKGRETIRVKSGYPTEGEIVVPK